ncbi:unnamed protein product [Psylliodes chrysocephalus]|uniref:Protein Mo25 n=1 Tax=Psylliodes chrysocephalus TaxID=3402493 RepID=A0A9P0CK30_9CUCU|nr:unnamed protein product [Psylliodes chrysocephala]
MPLFGKSQKGPADVVKALKEAVNSLEKGDKKAEKAQEDVSKNLVLIKNMLYGTSDAEPQADIIVAQLAQELYNSNLLLLLIQNLNRIDFEGKKDVAQVFNNILRRQIGTRSPTVEYICTKPEILFTLMTGYEHQEIALNCGTMLRECARYEALAKIMLYSEDFYNFFRYVEVSTFDIASDAFSTFKELLTRHKILCADFLETNYDKVFNHYQRLLNSENYVTRRQSLKLLGELLLDRHNFTVMTRYISNPDNLKLMMNMLKERSRNIQFEAFHVFKVFVANPNKPKPILDILLRNQEKLVEFLIKFHTDRAEDEQFNDEKAYLIRQIKELKPIPGH